MPEREVGRAGALMRVWLNHCSHMHSSYTASVNQADTADSLIPTKINTVPPQKRMTPFNASVLSASRELLWANHVAMVSPWFLQGSCSSCIIAVHWRVPWLWMSGGRPDSNKVTLGIFLVLVPVPCPLCLVLGLGAGHITHRIASWLLDPRLQGSAQSYGASVSLADHSQFPTPSNTNSPTRFNHVIVPSDLCLPGEWTFGQALLFRGDEANLGCPPPTTLKNHAAESRPIQ